MTWKASEAKFSVTTPKIIQFTKMVPYLGLSPSPWVCDPGSTSNVLHGCPLWKNHIEVWNISFKRFAGALPEVAAHQSFLGGQSMWESAMSLIVVSVWLRK